MTGQQRRVATNGVELDVIDAGEPGNPVVVLVHGFPESSHSWRHQIQPLVDAGYRVLVPDQRGYAHSTAPTDVDAYRVDHLAADLLGLLDDVGAKDAIFVGHDWGSMVVWDLSRLHPDRVRGVINVSVPYTPWPAPPTDLFKMVSGDRFFYILYFQQVGPPEAELEANVTDTMRKTLWGASAAMFGPAPDPADIPPMEGTGFLDMMAGREIPDGLPAWLTQADLDAYVEQFETSGFFGPVSWYRNLDADYELVEGPAGTVDADRVHRRAPGRRDRLPPRVRRGDGRPAARLQGNDLDRRRRALDPAGAAGRVQRGAVGADRSGRVELNGFTAGRFQPIPASLPPGGQWSSRLYAHHSSGLR